MSEQDDLVTKIDDLAKHIGKTVHTKLSEADASELYATKSSLKSLAYKDKVEAGDISNSILENLKGPQGPQGFGYYGGYVYKNLTLDEWKELGVLGSTHIYEVGDTSNIRIGDFGLVVGAVTDLSTTQALINFKVTGITSNSISTISLGFIVGEPGNMDNVDFSTLVTKEEHALDLDTLRQATVDAAANAAESYAYSDSSDILNNDVVVHAMGEWWFSIDGTIPAGGLPHLGQICSRDAYGQFWLWRETKGNVVTDAEWLAYADAHDGVCPYYSSGDGSTTFRTPRYSDAFLKVVQATANAGLYTQAGLPNHTHTRGTMNITGELFGTRTHSGSVESVESWSRGALYTNIITTSGYTTMTTTQIPEGNATGDGVCIDASRGWTGETSPASESNAIYGRSDTVTPKNVGMLVGVYAVGAIGTIGTAEAEDLLNAITTLETAKVDINLGNLSEAGRAVGAGLGMPSNRYIDLTLGASGTSYTAPANGWFSLLKNHGANSNLEQITLINYCGGSAPWVDGLVTRSIHSQTGMTSGVYMPVKKGDVVVAQYSFSGATNAFRFYYAEGAE